MIVFLFPFEISQAFLHPVNFLSSIQASLRSLSFLYVAVTAGIKQVLRGNMYMSLFSHCHCSQHWIVVEADSGDTFLVLLQRPTMKLFKCCCSSQQWKLSKVAVAAHIKSSLCCCSSWGWIGHHFLFLLRGLLLCQSLCFDPCLRFGQEPQKVTEM